jgi:energy-coupling factor transporter ATP-binding protein EcfA2
MRLKAVILEGFRAYQARIRVELGDLVAFIGKNDVGKSSILEALSIFFGSGEVKLDRSDLCVHGGATAVRIGAVFADLPQGAVLDATAQTTLADEHMLNADGDLEIHKVFDCSVKMPKESVIAVAVHPQGAAAGLLLKKNAELKQIVEGLGIDTSEIDLRSNPQLRRAIWQHCQPLQTVPTEIPLDKEDAKKIWDQLQKYLPVYALFKSDRPSQDADPEVQDPLKFAIAEAIKQLEAKLQEVETAVTERAKDVAQRTLAKLREMDPTLAAELSPEFKTDPKWDSIFKFALTCDHGVPLNKRGSGVRRLVLLNFFRAEAERRQTLQNAPGVVFAIEEPETSQHPSNQKLIVEAFTDLASQENTQVLLTTHVPGLAGLLPADSLRYVRRADDGSIDVANGSDAVFLKISRELGILPDRRVRVVVCVEGQHDVAFVEHMSALLRQKDASLVDLASDPRVVVIPLGGSSLLQWVQAHYLRRTGLPEIHIYDRDMGTPAKYQIAVDEVNARKDGSWATLTEGKREMENYLHADAIAEALSITVTFGPNDDVPLLVAQALHQTNAQAKPWDEVDEDTRRKKVSWAKKRLNHEAAAKMTVDRLVASDPNSEIEQWLRKITEMVA